ncbi:MAG: hypothetical protein GX577_11995 [Leptolinea sp.]|nr:hypothetical protein [Leptolinea sp.]
MNINRRDFLKILGTTGIAAAGLAYADLARPWINFDESVKVNKMKNADKIKTDKKMDLIHYATLAASGHNTQPWLFSIDRNHIDIHADMTRRLPVVDPQDRELWISLGCALENLLIAAREAGYSTAVTYPDTDDHIAIELTEDLPAHSELFDAIPLRQNTRCLFDGKALPGEDLTRLQTMPLEPGINCVFLQGTSTLSIAADFIRRGTLIQYAEKEFLHELVQWLRFNKKEALTSMDGLYSRCSGNPEVPRFIGRWFVEGTKPEQQAGTDAQKVMSSSGIVVIASATDTCSDWVRAGQVYERLTLMMTSMNIRSALLNQPLEVAEMRSPFGHAIGLENEKPQLLLRFGYAELMPASMRRPVEQLIEIKKELL